MVTAGMFEEVDVEDAKSKKEIVSVQRYLRENIPIWGARDGAVERALSSHHCGLGSNPSVNTICSGRKNVMSMRELFCPDSLAGFEKMAGFQNFFGLIIKRFHS